jgi:hypothetical protein
MFPVTASVVAKSPMHSSTGGWPRSRGSVPTTLRVPPVPCIWGPGKTQKIDREISFLQSRLPDCFPLSPGCGRTTGNSEIAPAFQLCGVVSGNCPAKNKDARDRSLWRLNGDEPAGTLDHASSRSALQLVSGLPRTPSLQAGPAMEPRVAPILASFGGAVSQATGRPVSLLLQFRLRCRFELPRIRHLPACLRSASGFPQISTFRLASGLSLRVAPFPAPFGLPRDGFPGCPGSSVPRRRLQVDLRVSPNLAPSGGTASASSERSESCVYGWADDDFPARLELCIPGPRPWMNLRVQSGLARSCSALNALSISFSLPLP